MLLEIAKKTDEQSDKTEEQINRITEKQRKFFPTLNMDNHIPNTPTFSVRRLVGLSVSRFNFLVFLLLILSLITTSCKSFSSGLEIMRQSQDEVRLREELAETGIDATGKLLKIADTGAKINNDPVVTMKLWITPEPGEEFEYIITSRVSRIEIPRVGDTVLLKIHPDDPSRIAYTGIMYEKNR